jgi:RNA polymerase sigma factor (sigma-70 family)
MSIRKLSLFLNFTYAQAARLPSWHFPWPVDGTDSGEGSTTVAETPGHATQGEFPPELADVLSARDEVSANSAWNRFLSSYGDLILRTARVVNRDHDATMDSYTHVLERLRAADFARLRKFSGGNTDNLSRWLVVVSRRLCLDLHRGRYGRSRENTPERERIARKRLVDELWEKRDPVDLADPTADNPEMELRRRELRTALSDTVSDLTPEEQLLISLRFDNQLSARRIAEILNLPTPFHVYRRLNGLLGRIQRQLESRGFTESEP